MMLLDNWGNSININDQNLTEMQDKDYFINDYDLI